MSIADKLTTIAENQQKVYDSGFAAGEAQGGKGAYDEGYNIGYNNGLSEGYDYGWSEGYDDGYDGGEQAEYDRFWDAVHDSIRTYGYVNVFSGAAWTKDTWRPTKSLLNIDYPYMMFRNSRIEVDLPAYLDELGIEITFAPAQPMQYTFYGTRFTRLGVFDFRNCQYLTQCCYDNPNLVTIDKVICDNKTKFDNCFGYCPVLENITFEGELATNGLNLQWSTKLSKASITSVINVLSDSTSGLTVTLSKAAVDREFGYYENGELLLPGSEDEPWSILVATKPNWTISLV
jgi:hypothetical protein